MYAKPKSIVRCNDMGAYSETPYLSFSQLQLGVFDALTNFNIGCRASTLIYECMNIIFGKYNLLGCTRINKARLWASKYDSFEPTKRWKARRGKANQKDD